MHEVVVGVRLEEAKEHKGEQEAQCAGHQTQKPLARRRETMARVHTAAGPTGGHDDEPGDERHEEQEDREAVPLGAERDKHHADHVQHEVHFAMAPKAQHAQVHFGNNQNGSPDGQEGKEKVAELENVIWQHTNWELRTDVAPVIELHIQTEI